jgi:hypothetical protein
MPTREAIMADLLACVTQDEANAALDAADAYLKDHPGDLELAGATESAEMVRSAWDLPLSEWPQADRDELLRERGRKVD